MALTEIFPPYGEGFGVEDLYRTGSTTGLITQKEAVRHFVCLSSEATAHRDGLLYQAYPLDSAITCARVHLVRNSRVYPGLSHLTAYYRRMLPGGTTLSREYRAYTKDEYPAVDLDGNWVYAHDGEHNYYRPTGDDRQARRTVAAGEYIILKEWTLSTIDASDLAPYVNGTNSGTFDGYAAGTLLFVGADIKQDIRNGQFLYTYHFLHDARGWNNLVRVTKGHKYQYDTGNGNVISWEATLAEEARRLYDAISFSAIPGL